MEIKINAVGFSASSQLEDFIQKKISKLDRTQIVEVLLRNYMSR